LISTAFVAVGIVFEYPEVKHEFIEWLRSRKKPWVVDPAPAGNRNRVPLWSLVGFLIVIVGVAGEGVYEGLLGINDTKIRKIDESSLAADELQIAQLQNENLTLQKQAGDAATSAHNAAIDAGNAKTASGDAKTLARGAHTEADALTGEITSAKQQAADAVSRLADAEQRLADSTQREAAAEAKLSAIKTPRSLIQTDELVTALKPFSGTEYVLNVSLDQESNEFIKPIAEVLDAAGWVRKQPKGMNLGNPTMKLDLGHGPEFVPSCIESGIGINAQTKQPLAILQATPFPQLPSNIRAALVLKTSLSASILPADDHNVDPGVIDPEPGEELPIRICVGQKPLMTNPVTAK
jgi:hypothetical protein